MSKVSAKTKILTFLSKTSGYNTLSVAQAHARFGIKNVGTLVSQLRREGYAIYANMKHRADGSPVKVYRLGRPSASFIAEAKLRGVTAKGTTL